MIKGILLKETPNMQNMSEAEILGRLDPLKESEGLGTHIDPISGKSIYRRLYYSDDIYISTYASESDFAIEAIWDVYRVLNTAAGNYIKAFRRAGDANTLIIAWPRYDDKFEDATYTLMIEEIIRIAAWMNKTFGGDLAVEYLKDYINTCIGNNGSSR